MTMRSERGTFLKGVSGNPQGRPRCESTMVRQRLAHYGEEVADMVINAALAGDMQAARIVLDRLCPPLKPSTVPINITLPSDPGIAGTARTIIEHAAEGQIGPDVAGQLVQAVAALARVVEIDEIDRRLSALEGKHEG